MKIKILFLLLFCGEICCGQTLIQSIHNPFGENFGSNLVMSGDYSTFAASVTVSIYSEHYISFYKKKEFGYELDSYFPVYNYINTPVIYLSDDAERCMVLKNFAGAGQVVPYVTVMEKNGYDWTKVGDSLDIELINPSNPGRRSCDFSSSGNSLVVRHETEANPNGIIKIYEFSGAEWQQKGQSIQSSSITNTLETVKMAQNGNMLVITEIGENPSITTWDFVNGNWQPRSSKINGPYDYMEIGENGELMVVINNEDKFINVYKYEENEWNLNSDDIWSSIEESTSNELFIALDIDLNLENDVFLATYRNNANQKTSFGIYSWVPEQSYWFERRMELTSESLFNQGGRYNEISATGDTMLISRRFFNQYAGIIDVYEKPKNLTVLICAFIDFNLNQVKDDFEPFVFDSQYEVDDSIINASPSNPYYTLKMEEGRSTIKYISARFESVVDSFIVEGAYDQLDTLCIPVQYLDSSDVQTAFLGWADTYVCNDSTDFSFTIVNHSPKPYDYSLEMRFEGLDPPNHSTIALFENIGALQPLELYEYTPTLEMPNETYTGEELDIKIILIVEDKSINQFVDTLTLDMSGILRCSFDPNDKTAYPLGEREAHYTLFDQSIQYKIRFQNTGNFPAGDVAITDQLDENLDWSSFRLVKTSHELTNLNIVDGLVTFEFDNIQLPDSISNEPLSHGYVMFGINPKSNLAEKTVVKNKASIYFDFNAPIVTNETFNTLVSEIPEDGVSTTDLSAKSINIFPNPVGDILYFTSDIEIEKIDIHDINGQFISTVPHNNYMIDLAGLDKVGIYFIKMYTAKGIQTMIFMKSE